MSDEKKKDEEKLPLKRTLEPWIEAARTRPLEQFSEENEERRRRLLEKVRRQKEEIEKLLRK